jgi:hypothetical protein
LGVLLYQRGLTLFHASVVALNGGAVAFLASKGWGKSTMAAYFHNLGRCLLADDILAINLVDDIPMVFPGFPQLKLWPDSMTAIGQPPESFPRLRSDLDKRNYRVTNGYSADPIPLRCIYLLDYGLELTLERVQAGQAVLDLLPHWYCVRFGKDALKSLGHSIHFLQCARLATHVPVYRLKRPPSLAALPEMAELIEAHVTSGHKEPS